ncbi:MAG: protein translocase subunit SecD, partial [Minisyncoccia bacterium]
MVSKKRLAAILVFLIALSLCVAVFDYEPLWQKISSFGNWNFGLDLAGGSLLTYEIDLSKVNVTEQSSVVTGLRDVIEKRVNLFGVSEPRVYVEKSGSATRLVVELAGISDVGQAIKEIGATPFLDFREVAKISSSTSASTTLQFVPTNLNGRYITSAQLGFSSVTRQPEVDLQFNGEGADIFAELTGKNVGKPLAIFLDNQLIEMPTVEQKITGGKAQITGGFTIDSAKQLVERFNAGALPAPITLV